MVKGFAALAALVICVTVGSADGDGGPPKSIRESVVQTAVIKSTESVVKNASDDGYNSVKGLFRIIGNKLATLIKRNRQPGAKAFGHLFYHSLQRDLFGAEAAPSPKSKIYEKFMDHVHLAWATAPVFPLEFPHFVVEPTLRAVQADLEKAYGSNIGCGKEYHDRINEIISTRSYYDWFTQDNLRAVEGSLPPGYVNVEQILARIEEAKISAKEHASKMAKQKSAEPMSLTNLRQRSPLSKPGREMPVTNEGVDNTLSPNAKEIMDGGVA